MNRTVKIAALSVIALLACTLNLRAQEIPDVVIEHDIEIPEIEIIEEMTHIDDPVFIVVEEMPTFMGGDITEFFKWVAWQATFPESMIHMEGEATVVAQFVVDRDGSVAGRYSPAYLPENLEKEIEALL